MFRSRKNFAAFEGPSVAGVDINEKEGDVDVSRASLVISTSMRQGNRD